MRRHGTWLRWVVTSVFPLGVFGFEVFSEQQILTLNDPTLIVNYNNTVYGSTHVDDYWTKLDIAYSPLEGWQLFKHVRLGCFMVAFGSAPPEAYVETAGPEMDEIECVKFCNLTQAYYQYPLCRCGLNESELFMTEAAGGTCPLQSWEVFREFDYRSSMSPATYDVTRRLLYQIVTLRVPHVDPTIQYYIHAVNAMEAKPKFEFDTRLERMVFNAVWDFGRSRLVALSFEDWGAPLDFTLVAFNTSTGVLMVQQAHYPLMAQISADGSLVSSGLASADGMGTVDILFGTYYTVVPAVLSTSPQVVHVIVAIDIETRQVIHSRTLPITLMNLQINSLQHTLYGAGADLSGRYGYYELCRATNVTVPDGIRVEVECPFTELSALPGIVNLMYLQSATIDHHFNYAWMTYKVEATGRPLILEYHQNSAEYVLWRPDSLPLEAAFSSLIQTAPRIIFSLYPPSIKYARFSTSGTKIFVVFDAPTLRGAVPIDADGDELPDYWNNDDKVTRAPCEDFFDDFTMELIPGSMCQWTSDSSMFIEINAQATIMPGDLIRIRGNRLWAGRRTPGGVYLFSQPSTDFAIVEVPEYIPYPKVFIGGNLLIDTCTPLVLDGSQSKDHGFRGTFVWTLNRTEPAKPEPHIRQIGKILGDLQEGPVSPRIITFPSGVLEGSTKYYVMLTVFSFWDTNIYSSLSHGVMVSSTPVPPLAIFGASQQTVAATEPLRLGARVYLEGCLNASAVSAVGYSWIGCLSRDQLPDVFQGIPGCLEWDSSSIAMESVSGTHAKSLYIEPLALEALQEYVFTVTASVSTPQGVLQNVASVTVFVALGDLFLSFRGGTGFSAPRDRPIVVDVSSSVDPSDPDDVLGGLPYFNFSCEVLSTGAPCFSPPPSSSFPPGDGWTADPFRRLSEDTLLPDSPCNSLPHMFTFRGGDYNHSEAVTYGDLLREQWYCMQGQGVLIIQQDSLEVMEYAFRVNMTKIIAGAARTVEETLFLRVLEPNGVNDDASPLVVIEEVSEMPYVVSETLRLAGDITNKRNTSAYTYSWSVEMYSVNPDYDPDRALTDPSYDVPVFKYITLDETTLNLNDPDDVKTPAGSRFLVIPPNVLAPGMKYRLRLEASDSVLSFRDAPDAVGYAEIYVDTLGLPPSGGRLEVSALTGTAFETVFTYALEDWGSDDIPLRYQFGYIREFSDPHAEATYLGGMWVQRNFLDSVLPPGAEMPAHRLRLIGYVRSSHGAVTTASLELSVPPPTDGAARQRVLRTISEFDAETALLAATMIAQDAMPNSLELAQVLNATLSAGVMNTSRVPNTRTTSARTAHFLGELCRKGLKTQEMLETVERLAEGALAMGFTSPDAVLWQGPGDVVQPMLAVSDCLLPGEVLLEEGSGLRRLFVEQQRARGLQQVATSLAADTRPAETQHEHLLQVRALERRLCTALLQHTFPGEVPVKYSLRGHELYIGKDATRGSGLLRQHSDVQESFALPSLDGPDLPEVYAYRYVQFKKYPYLFMPLPERQTLFVPSDSVGVTSRRIPLQGYPTDERLWHAMSLEITDEMGEDAADMVSLSLENASFSILPRIAAHPLRAFATYKHASTCYVVNVGDNLTSAHYDPRGIVYSEDSCVTKHLADFVVLIDDLATELELMEESAGDFLGSYLDGYRSMAMVGMIVFTLIIALAAAACAFYVDVIEPDDVESIDDLKHRVIEAPDPKERLLETLLFTFKRDHLLIGLGHKHRKLTREKRVEAVLLTWLATEAVTTVMNTKLSFKAERHFIAIGLVAGVLVFPLTQFVEFLFRWCPQTRGKLPFAPLGSTPAKPIPLKQQVHVPHVHKPKKPAIPQRIVPPPPGAPLRVAAHADSVSSPPLLPPGLPLELPALRQGDGSKKIAPPPRQERQAPRPPKEPPPVHHLMAARAPGNPLHFEGLKPLTLSLQGSGPFGLKLPELPPLPIGTHRLEGGEIPAPPPKRPGAGPKPPQAPPPLTKMFFALPQHAQLHAPPVAVPFKAAGGPKLPPLPRLMHPHEALGLVKRGGRDVASLAVPPPPPPKEVLRHFPAPPMTPREEEDTWVDGSATPTTRETRVPASLPISVGPAELSAAPRASSTQPAAAFQGHRGGAAASVDAEASPRTRLTFALEPEHRMMRPLRAERALPPPLLTRGPLPSRPPLLPALPNAPSPTRALAHPDGTLPHLPEAALWPAISSTPHAPLEPLPLPSENALVPTSLPPLQAPPGQKRMPALPKHLPLQLVPRGLMKVPAVQQHVDLAAPPPPPPPLAPPGWDRPSPPEEGEPSAATQHLMPYKPPGLSGRPPPQPPQKSQALVPTPPEGPPPAHAIILAKKTGFSGIDEQALIKKVNALPAVPKVPEAAVPAFVRRNLLPEAPHLALKDKDKAVPLVRPGRDAPLKVVPDWAVQASFWAAQIFVGGCIVGSCFFIVYWGVFLESRAQWATHAASFVGCVMNLGIFESMKCVVITCVNLVKSETEKRQEELNARRVRMQLKAQRLQERAARRRKAKLPQEQRKGRAPPLLSPGALPQQ